MVLWVVSRVAFVLSAIMLGIAHVALLSLPARIRPGLRLLKAAVTKSAFYVEMTA